jgi:DNA repair protein RadC
MMNIVTEAIKALETQVKEGQMEYKISGPSEIKDLLVLKMAKKKSEEFGIVLVDQSNRVMKFKTIERGIQSRCHIYMRNLVKFVLNTDATGVILYHNHPSESTVFSAADIDLTKAIKNVLTACDVRVLDHIVVAGTSAVSMKGEGQFPM